MPAAMHCPSESGCVYFLYNRNKEGFDVKRLLSSIIPLLLLVSGTSCLAQTVTGAVRGTITDSSGAIVPGATATAKNAACRITAMQRFLAVPSHTSAQCGRLIAYRYHAACGSHSSVHRQSSSFPVTAKPRLKAIPSSSSGLEVMPLIIAPGAFVYL